MQLRACVSLLSHDQERDFECEEFVLLSRSREGLVCTIQIRNHLENSANLAFSAATC